MSESVALSADTASAGQASRRPQVPPVQEGPTDPRADPRGSTWRKWDLHVHTPASFHWKGGKRLSLMTVTEKEQSLKELLDTINSSDVDVFAFMDYWTFEGYIEFRRFLKSHPDMVLRKTVFPGMELRVDAPVDYRLNVHVLLSDALTEQQLCDLKSQLVIRFGGATRPLSDEALVEFGKTLDSSKAKRHGFGDPATLPQDDLLRLGSMTAEVSRDCLHSALQAIPGKLGLVVLPYDTSDGLSKLDWETHPHADNYFMQSADLFETRDAHNVDLFLGRRTERNNHFIDNFVKTLGGEPKPAICGSDAHRFAEYGVYPSGRACWIKADCTFRGLLQVLEEPAQRTFIDPR